MARLSPSRSDYPGSLSYPFTTTQHDNGKPEWENLRQGSADEPFNREIAVQLKKHDKVLPTFIVTGYAAEEERASTCCAEMSVTGCLHKPFDPEQLSEPRMAESPASGGGAEQRSRRNPNGRR